MTSEWPMGQKFQGRALCIPIAVNHFSKSAWLGDSGDLRRKDTLELKSVPIKVNQVKQELPLQNSSHQLAFSGTRLCIEYNREKNIKIFISLLLFTLLLMHFK